jgi:hypothetical protein
MTPVKPFSLTMSPSVLSTAGKAFDLAWLEIAGNYGREATKNARDRLARIIMANPARTRPSRRSSGQGSPAWRPLSECVVHVRFEWWMPRKTPEGSERDSQ